MRAIEQNPCNASACLQQLERHALQRRQRSAIAAAAQTGLRQEEERAKIGVLPLQGRQPRGPHRRTLGLRLPRGGEGVGGEGQVGASVRGAETQQHRDGERRTSGVQQLLVMPTNSSTGWPGCPCPSCCCWRWGSACIGHAAAALLSRRTRSRGCSGRDVSSACASGSSRPVEEISVETCVRLFGISIRSEQRLHDRPCASGHVPGCSNSTCTVHPILHSRRCLPRP